MCAPSVERGGGENGWAGGLTGGALRAGPEPPTKTSGEICCLEQCRPDAESPGPFSSGVGQRCRGGPRSNGEHALHQQGLPPGGGLRWWPRLSAVLGRPHGGSGERRHEGSHQPARAWGRCGGGWCQARTSAPVTLGVGWVLLRAGYRVRPAAVAVVGSVARGGRHPAPALNAAPAARRATQRRFAVSFRHFLRSGDHTQLETALPALSPGPGDRAG